MNNLMTNREDRPRQRRLRGHPGGRREVLFGVDGVRPLQGTVFTSIALNLLGVSTDTTVEEQPAGADRVNRYQPCDRSNTDDEFKVTSHSEYRRKFLKPSADRIELHIVPTDSIDVRSDERDE